MDAPRLPPIGATVIPLRLACGVLLEGPPVTVTDPWELVEQGWTMWKLVKESASGKCADRDHCAGVPAPRNAGANISAEPVGDASTPSSRPADRARAGAQNNSAAVTSPGPSGPGVFSRGT